MRWLDKLPLLPVSLGALLLGLAPFTPMPHLWEKLLMLFSGTLTVPVDIFDLFLHAFLPVLLILKVIRLNSKKTSGNEG